MAEGREQHLRQYDTGQYLLSLRNQLGVSLATVSNALGVTPAYISEIERGLKLPSDQLIRSVSKYYKIDETDLFRRFGKIPLLAREEFERSPGLQKVLTDIRKERRLGEDDKQRLYDSITKLYMDFLKTLGD